ncbi:Phytochelatin synthase [Cynara cardunculus var. scolymus]|uniref:glutathione gamma-glutamylcysteinyltransferase n=1 Tax=Cynara cardunculus var. scolymus TaxID=59895 RepID=A0A124SID3_CYNCS|nr:Phytochelatin synthase [Cynara cardunculus var. scolymus]
MAMAGIYRRVLPSPPAIDFASSEGKQLFMEATQGGTMEGFFKLISYFQTQSEPAYCGLATLAMVLNALSIDPGRKWKGPWRWFDESMLDCCEPLEKVKAEGISFGKVVCLAHCAGAKVEAFRTNQSSIDEFRKHVIACSTSDDRHVISSYNRATFKQACQSSCGRELMLFHPRLGHFFMLISRLQRPPALLYTLSCKHESWVNVAKYLVEDVPVLLSSKNVKDVKDVLSIVFNSLPSKVLEFIKWVAEVRRTEEGDQSLSPEEQERLAIKVSYCHEPTSVCCQGAGILKGNSESPNGFCCGETHVHCIKSTGNVPATVVSGTVTNGIGEQHVDMLVPSSAKNLSPSSSGLTSCIGMHPASNDVLTTLLLALPPQTWSGIKDDSLFQEIKSLVSIDNLPTFLQEEIMHLRSQLHFLKRCKDDEVKHQDTSDKAMVFLHGSKSNLHNQGKLSLLGQQRSLGCCSRLADRYERLDRVSGGIKRIITWPKPIAYASIRSIFSVNYLSR